MRASLFFRSHRSLLLFLSVLLIVAGVFVAQFNHRTIGPSMILPSGIPLPFGPSENTMRGAITFFERRNNIDVYEVTFTAGEVSETFEENIIYLVHSPTAISPQVLDATFQTLSGGRAVNYFGYEYVDTTASVERARINAPLFRDRFPGTFFASQKSRIEDVTHGNTLSRFELNNGVEFKSTIGASGITMKPNLLYVFAVNEPGKARFFPGGAPGNGTCGNSIKEGIEQCDDGNQSNNDECQNDCTTGIPIPFSGAPSISSISSSSQSSSVNTVSSTSSSVVTIASSVSSSASIRFIVDVFSSSSRSSSSLASIAQSSASVAPPVCGNGVQENTEECDNGDRNGVSCLSVNGQLCEFCSNDCHIVRVIPDPVATIVCGNGVLEQGEQCDDMNKNDGDGCSVLCRFEQNFGCTQSSTTTPTRCSECVLPACAMPPGDCQYIPPVSIPGQCSGCGSFTCEPPLVVNLCGNGEQDANETCDQGNDNRTNGDGCSAECGIEPNFRCTGWPTTCISYRDFTIQLADTSAPGSAGAGVVSENEAFLFLLDLYDLPLSGVDLRYDITGDGVVNSGDLSILQQQIDDISPV